MEALVPTKTDPAHLPQTAVTVKEWAVTTSPALILEQAMVLKTEVDDQLPPEDC